MGDWGWIYFWVSSLVHILTFSHKFWLNCFFYLFNSLFPTEMCWVLLYFKTCYLLFCQNGNFLHRRNPSAVRHWCAQHCDSENEHSAVTVIVWIVMLQSWQWQCFDVYTSVTAMTTDTAVTAVATDSAVSAVAADTAVTAMFTLVWQWWQLTVMWQRWNWQRCHRGGSWQHCDSDVYISVTALPVANTFTMMCTSLSH